MKPTFSLTKLAFVCLLCGPLFFASVMKAEPRMRADGIIFPQSSAAAGLSTGSVEVMIAVDETGSTASITVLSSTHKELEDAVHAAVNEWKFSPATSGGQPVIGMLRHTFKFENGRFEVDEMLIKAFEGAIHEPAVRADGVVLPELPSNLETVSGKVELYVAVDRSGIVIDVVTASSTNASLESVVRKAITQWAFDPVNRDGTPVAGLYKHTFEYENGQHRFDEKLWRVLAIAANVPTLRADGVVLPKLPASISDITGNVDVMVAVNRKGKVASVVSMATTDSDLAKSVHDAITAWTFNPALSSGNPVIGLYRHGFQFESGKHIFNKELWSVLNSDPVEPRLRADGIVLPEVPAGMGQDEGKVQMLIATDIIGSVAGVTPIASTDGSLDNVVAETVKQWKFDPATRDGKPAIGIYSYTFRYEGGEALVDAKLWRVLSQAVSARDPAPQPQASAPAAGSSSSNDPFGAKSVATEMNGEAQILPEVKRTRGVQDIEDVFFGVLRRVEPELPAELRNIRGKVDLIFDVDPSGRVDNVTVENYTHEELIDPTLRAGLGWRFDITGERGVTQVRVAFNFNERALAPRWENLVDAQFGKVEKKPVILRSFVPEIPRNRASIDGEIQALIAIDENGYVTSAEIERGVDKRLDKDALEGLYRWKFTPAMANGRPVAAKLRQIVTISDGQASIDLGQLDKQPEVRYSPKPLLRGAAARMQGFVLMRLRVDEKGIVTDARVVESTNSRLEEPSIDVSRSWEFTPAYHNGRAVKSTIVIPFFYPMNDAG